MDIDHGEYKELVEQKKQELLLAAKQHLDRKQLKIVRLAFQVSDHAHAKQKRKSGEPYITHPLQVATIIAKWGLDEQTIASALLHDTIEDTEVSKSEIEQIFGIGVAELVDAVTKLDKLNFESEEVAYAEYFRKVVLAMAKDIRVILIKLADRLHNMSTLDSMSPAKQYKISLETMEIYAPIANKIGLHKAHLELANSSFKYLHPFRYNVISKAASIAQEKRFPIIQNILENIGNSLKANGIKANFIYRQRTIYNLYRRMLIRKQSFERIYDIFEIKVIVDTIRECYLTLGVLHSLYQPLPGKFKDYIALPKSNGYQSLHSTLMGPQGIPIQIHIRTSKMDQVAENGIISHWLKHQNDDEFISANQRTNTWLNNILDIQSSTFSAREFLNSIKQDLSPGDVYVFTPKGKIMLLPRGSTPIDFAYLVHTDVGNHCYQAKINQQLTKLDTKLQNGDIVEIISREDAEPSEKWLSFAVSGKAISKIKMYLKEQKYEEDTSKGFKLIGEGLSLFDKEYLLTHKMLSNICNKFYPNLSVLELEHEAGVGTIAILEIVKHIIECKKDEILEIALHRCNMPIIQDQNCLALPGEVVLANITRNNELHIHRVNCKQNKHIGLDNLTFVHITNDTEQLFLTKINLTAINRPGIFTKFTSIIGEKNINIEEITQESRTNFAYISVTLSIQSIEQLEELINTLSNLEYIEHITRV